MNQAKGERSINGFTPAPMKLPTSNNFIRLAVLAVCVLARTVYAEVSLPKIFGDGLVLQRGGAVPVWGWAAEGEKVTVEFAGQRKTAIAVAGSWEVRLRSMPASSLPRELVITGANRIVFTNVLVGEVWLCAGQSNMEKPVGSQPGQKPTVDFEKELAAGDAFPQIRLFKVERALAATPERDVKAAGWMVCSSNALETAKFSAVGYFFGRQLQHELKVPIGLIESSWGGTRIEPWTPPEGFRSVPKLADLAKPIAPGTNKLASTRAMAIFNAMIAPLAGFALRGALWYQGESNCMDAHDGLLYADKMEALIRGWRRLWRQGDFPFYFVQLAPFNYFTGQAKPRVPNAEALPEIWEAQTLSLRLPHTGMAVITDLVDNLKDIHPTRKREVGERLARIALARDYGQNLVCSGPTFRNLKIRDGRAVLRFDHADGGLVSRNGQPLNWFTLAGADGNFVAADAVISGDTVSVSSPAVPQPVAVRFAWNELAQPNLFNGAGLPAGPFRTDGPVRK